ncbi:uroporphyrinogen-III C-methyltransferase [Alcanivorax sp. JB21]|uniref:uroporphyrinogen-III C-methyltransferase n=1 Tax=Alcanivorax limicola TaxID=2874102 RepID=UPI001CBF43DA|nr:uroporphyrinogen-III C-methyltransferase [Alcanivorax limicola]MBZ2190322.1 uroporphyrinogen-III C-methyltransferase [Alcanivorax limicola]
MSDTQDRVTPPAGQGDVAPEAATGTPELTPPTLPASSSSKESATSEKSAAPSGGKPPPPPRPPVKRARKRRRGGGLILLLLLLLLAGSGYLGWQWWQSLQHNHGAWRGAVSELQSSHSRMMSQMESERAYHNQRMDELEGELAERDQMLLAMREGGQQYWLINEAISLASLAEQQLLLTADAEAAARLLHAADEVLARSDDSAMLPLREALAADIASLNAAGRVDITGLLLRLGALQRQVSGMTLPERARSAAPEVAADEQAEAATWWERLLARLPVRVRTHEGRAPVPLDAESRQVLRLALESALQEARLSLLQGRTEIFEDALGRADAMAAEWFSEHDPAVTAFRDALNEIAQVPVARAMPDIGAGLVALKQARAARSAEEAQ